MRKELLKKTTVTTIRGRANEVVRQFEAERKIVNGRERLYIHSSLYITPEVLGKVVEETASPYGVERKVTHVWTLVNPVAPNHLLEL